jgi:hypothetical protein
MRNLDKLKKGVKCLQGSLHWLDGIKGVENKQSLEKEPMA